MADVRKDQHAVIERRPDGWWIVGYECGDCGPYSTKAEAEQDRRGMRRWYREHWREYQQELIPTGKRQDKKKSDKPGQMSLFE